MKLKMSVLASLLIAFSSQAMADQVKTLISDEGALLARFSLIKTAKKEILAEYFEVANDETSMAGLALLQEAAKRGVKVKLLIDNMHNQLNTQEMAAVTNALQSMENTKNFEIKVFNPLTSLNVLKLTYRNHDKLLNIDGETMIVGGRNVADGYFGMSKKTNFRDMDVMITGDSARKAREYFMTLWEKNPMVKVPNFYEHSPDAMDKSQCLHNAVDVTTCEQRAAQAQRQILNSQNKIQETILRMNAVSARVQPRTAAELFNNSDNVDVNFLFNDPNQVMAKVEDKLEEQLGRYIQANAKKNLTIVTPYLFPTERAMSMLKDLSSQGVKIRIVTNSLASTDTPLVHAAFLTIKKQFKDMGAEVYEYVGPDTLHMKVCILDDGTENASTMIGSFNFDRRSALINREIGVTIQGQDRVKVANRISSALDRVIRTSVLSIKDGQFLNEDQLNAAIDRLGPEEAQKKREDLAKNQGLLVKLLANQI